MAHYTLLQVLKPFRVVWLLGIIFPRRILLLVCFPAISEFTTQSVFALRPLNDVVINDDVLSPCGLCFFLVGLIFRSIFPFDSLIALFFSAKFSITFSELSVVVLNMYNRRSRNSTVSNLTAIYQEEEPLDLSNDVAETVTAASKDSTTDIRPPGVKSTEPTLAQKRFRSADADRFLLSSQFAPLPTSRQSQLSPLKGQQRPPFPLQDGRSISALKAGRDLSSTRRQNSISPLQYPAFTTTTTSDDKSFSYSFQSASNPMITTTRSSLEHLAPWSSSATRCRANNFQSTPEQQSLLSALHRADVRQTAPTARLLSSTVSSGRSRRRGTKTTTVVGKSTVRGKVSTTIKRRKIDPTGNISLDTLPIETSLSSAQMESLKNNRSQLFYRMLAMSNAQATNVAMLSQFPSITADTDAVMGIQRILSSSAPQFSPVYPPLLMQQFAQTMYLRNNAQLQLALQYRQRYHDSTDNSVIGTSKSSSPMTNHVKG